MLLLFLESVKRIMRQELVLQLIDEYNKLYFIYLKNYDKNPHIQSVAYPQELRVYKISQDRYQICAAVTPTILKTGCYLF